MLCGIFESVHVLTEDGRRLDAEYSVVAEDSELLSLVMESSSGTRSSTNRVPRNVDYRQALEVLLRRLKARDAVLVSGVVDSRVTATLPADERRLFPEPITLAEADDIPALRRQLCTAQSKIGQAPGASKGGNGTKRIRLELSVPRYQATGADAERLAKDLAAPTPVQVVERHDVLVSSPQAPTTTPPAVGSAGYVTDAILRKAIEQHAVRCAMDCYRGYEIRDVGTTESYDLVAIRGDEEIHIEVKGSAGIAEAVELTINEVTHARATRTDLVVVDHIGWRRRSDGSIATRGGRRRHWVGWEPADQDLQVTRYRYHLPDR